jgi:murein DD-endopeptidase MepM/ murein hydrolase activator NlpD
MKKLRPMDSFSISKLPDSRILLLIFLLCACAPASATSTELDQTPTAVIAGEIPIQAPAAAQREATPRPTIEPFRFVLPTPGAEPVSGWRPPLYPVPWAVSANDHFYFTRPIAADNVNWPLAQYRYGAVLLGSTNVHTGVDVDAPEGTPILAAGPGTVVSADWGLFTEAPGNENDPYGKAVVVRHDFGYQGQTLFTIYAHMSEIIAVAGQHVDTGDVIGLVGDTGATTGPHLHFEVRMGLNNFYRTYNPELWMSPPQGWGVLVGRFTNKKGDLLTQLPVEVRPLPSEKPVRTVLTYAQGAANSDPYYQENMALSDLPAGIYKILINFNDKDVQFFVEIFPGQVTYFTFTEKHGFQDVTPLPPKLDFLPTTPTATKTAKP